MVKASAMEDISKPINSLLSTHADNSFDSSKTQLVPYRKHKVVPIRILHVITRSNKKLYEELVAPTCLL